MTAETPLRLLVLDVDGTIVDSLHNIVAAMEMAAADHGIVCPPPARCRRVVGLELVEAVATLFPDLDDALHRAVADSYKRSFQVLRAAPDHVENLYAGAVDAIAALEAQNVILGIATGKSRRGVAAMLARHGLEGRFLTIQTPDDNPGKPHPGMLLRAMAETGAASEHTVMVGDTTYDMAMARAARCHALGVAWGYHPVEELHAAGAHVVIEDYADLLAAAQRLWCGGAGEGG
ncbi:HAD-IA family hydrolase [Caenispirillum bisanense]|uniref:Phosphoglycolate phosphatase n=1 Tax=Caenispirillum bisanense TaxID=414052 RepID=A0A286GZI4_9PROT|nr:HAD-IA family hydrolase [Caenispirillum bisanense]SOE00509.1 phosphoglycolate phosphatase [Caenispirillum bisanense]